MTGATMKGKDPTDSRPLLWDCFTNWADLLKKIEETKKTSK
jgi:hypothetical protein